MADNQKVINGCPKDNLSFTPYRERWQGSSLYVRILSLQGPGSRSGLSLRLKSRAQTEKMVSLEKVRPTLVQEAVSGSIFTWDHFSIRVRPKLLCFTKNRMNSRVTETCCNSCALSYRMISPINVILKAFNLFFLYLILSSLVIVTP